jgi:hypothetical protein
MFNEEYRRMKVIIDNNSYRCLSIAMMQIGSEMDDGWVSEYNQMACHFFMEQGFLRAVIMGS